MGLDKLQALEALRLNWTRDLKDVWAPCSYHIEGLHPRATRVIRRGIDDTRESTGPNTLGVAIQGEGGVGKTHLLGWTREQVQAAGGYFFLVGDLSRTGFWSEVLGSMVAELLPMTDGDESQLTTLLADLADKAGLEDALRPMITGQRSASPDAMGAFVATLRRLAPRVVASQDTARALVLLASPEFQHQDVGHNFFAGGQINAAEREYWQIKSPPKQPHLLIQELSGLLALSGPTVLAVDQIDALIDAINRAAETGPSPRDAVREVTNGLMALRDMTYRTLTVISCLPETWQYVREYAIQTVTGRFGDPLQLQNIPSADVGRLLIEKRFAPGFASVGFRPAYPSWPIRPEAFEGARRYTARTLLQRIEAHVSRCLDEHQIQELYQLDGTAEKRSGDVPATVSDAHPPDSEKYFAALDVRFRELKETTDVSGAFTPETEDEKMSALLGAALESWIKEHGDGSTENLLATELLSPRNPALHASLRMIMDQHTERQRRWAFRAITSENPKAVQVRLRKAIAAAGLGAEGTERQLFVLRNSGWPNGRVTNREVAELSAKGGSSLSVTGDDLKTFAALQAMLATPGSGLRNWLIARQPAHRTELLSQALGDVGSTWSSEQPSRQESDAPQVPATPAIRVGTIIRGQMPATVDLNLLRRHLSIFAGAGTGKTVLLRRVIEECALHGVSSIVLDTNNDLALLGDPWPEPPKQWVDGDAGLALRYLADTDVVVWTPGKLRGRPLSFRPLPVFADILDDLDKRRAEDEFQEAVQAAVGALAPRVNADRGTDKAGADRAVLTQAMEYFGRGGGSDLEEFIALLGDLPDEVSTVDRASALAMGLANRLRVARVNDPLFAGSGEPLDPGVLLSPAPGKRARVSVINMAGLGLEQQQSFVNQLQMALFSWIKKHPARDQPLSGLLVMDEAQQLAPSGKETLCRQSTLRLVTQARKYGLGMLFATQQPRGVHNSIPNNSTTQFYGQLGSQAQISAARELARAKGSDIPDIGRLKPGEFYFSTDGAKFRKIRTPLCLSHHPQSPLSEDEVISRARER